MSNPEKPPQTRHGSPVTRHLFRSGTVLAATTLVLAIALVPAARAAEKPEELYFAGKLIELNAAKHTFTIRSKNKELVFTIDPGRCDITVDGSVSERSLRWARIGDAVMGELSLKEAKPYVTWVEFTHQPLPGRPVAGKPGFIHSPYGKWMQPWNASEAADVRKLSHGDMVMDDDSGKIFLVP